MAVPAPLYQYSTLTAAEQARLACDVISTGQADALGTGHLARLERTVAARIGRTAAVAVDSGSAALALAMRGLGIGPGRGDTRQRAEPSIWRGKHRMTEVSAVLALPQLAHLDILTAALRRAQRRIVELLTASGSIPAVLPALRDIPAGDGSLVGLWLATPEQASQLSSAYYQAGLRSWWPGPGDLHTAAAWPSQPSRTVTDVRCYLDLQVPWLPEDQHAGFAANIASVTADALSRCTV